MKRYTRDEIKTFLQAIDDNLIEHAELIIIGGTAAALFYSFKDATQDIDTRYSVSSIEPAIEKARQQTGFDIPVGPARIHDGPWDWESRVVDYEESTYSKLSVKAPEAVDLILMKTMRAEAHDLDAIEAIIQDTQIEATKIHLRFLNDMTHVIGDPDRIRMNYLGMIDRCFGSSTAKSLERDLLKHANPHRKP